MNTVVALQTRRFASAKLLALFVFQSIEILRTRCKLNNPRMNKKNKAPSALFFLFKIIPNYILKVIFKIFQTT